ncbi:MAG: hypothetical protein KJZ93_31520 [Caldilineaceae bacterium]|nr:hypothetical protein [Caldilineaceae bacterium]
MSEQELREALAAYAHEAWSGWMKYMIDVKRGWPDAYGGWTIAAESLERWRRQMNTDYADLPESEKASDRAEADKMLAIIRGQQ